MSFLAKNFGHLLTLAFPQGESQELLDMQAPPPTPSSLPHLGCPGGSGHRAHQPAGHGTSSAASGPGLQGSVGSVCSSSPPSHFSLFQTVNLGSGLTVLFPYFHGSEPSNVFTCKMPGDLRLFRPEDGVTRPPAPPAPPGW